MDRSSLIGITLIALVVSVWIFFQSTMSVRDVTPQQSAQKKERVDSSTSATAPAAPAVGFQPAPDRTITVTTDNLKVQLSSKGATITSYVLRKYQPWCKDEFPDAYVDLVERDVHEYGFSFRSKNGSKVSAEDIPFTWLVSESDLSVGGSDSLVVVGRAVTDSGGVIERTYTFHGSQYAVATSITLDGMEDEIPATNRFIQLEWAHGIRYQELNSVAESDNATAIASYGGEIHELDADELNQPVSEKATGNIQFLGTRIKYFAVAMIPEAGFDGMVQYNGVRTPLPDEGVKETYSLLYRLPYRGGRQTHHMTLFAGPMQYDTLGRYGLTEMMNFGFKWIVKPIGEYFMLPTMKFIQKFIPNWGVSIILFALLLKGLLYPLSVPQMKSAQKMRLVAPLLNDVREKYKDDMKRQQQETMRLYSEYGINPAGGCLPLLLQMPFLYALYSVLNMNIELRQSAFLPVWITDLSVPDVVLDLGFKIPLFGIDKFSGLALLMGATLFIQQKQMITDPKQKGLVYMMPVLLTLMFSTLPAGLNLYYFIFNLVGIGQQVWMTKFSKSQLSLADLKAQPKKEGWLQKRMREAQQLAEAQGRAVPGRPQQQGGKGSSRKKK